jgi:hypothetical protein
MRWREALHFGVNIAYTFSLYVHTHTFHFHSLFLPLIYTLRRNVARAMDVKIHTVDIYVVKLHFNVLFVNLKFSAMKINCMMET